MTNVGPCYDLPTVMTRFLHCGMALAQVVEASTLKPAKAIGWADRIGRGDESRPVRHHARRLKLAAPPRHDAPANAIRIAGVPGRLSRSPDRKTSRPSPTPSRFPPMYPVGKLPYTKMRRSRPGLILTRSQMWSSSWKAIWPPQRRRSSAAVAASSLLQEVAGCRAAVRAASAPSGRTACPPGSGRAAQRLELTIPAAVRRG